MLSSNRFMLLPMLAIALSLTMEVSAVAQQAPPPVREHPSVEVGVDYNYVRTNAPPGGCGCFSLNGGDAWAAYKVTDSIAVLGQFSAQHASAVLGSGIDATLVSYQFGPRYSFTKSRKFVPFAQGLLGGASLLSGSGLLTTSTGTSSAFAMTLGGGLDIRLTRHFSLRPAELDYFYTRFPNGGNDHQNNLRAAAGMSYRF